MACDSTNSDPFKSAYKVVTSEQVLYVRSRNDPGHAAEMVEIATQNADFAARVWALRSLIDGEFDHSKGRGSIGRGGLKKLLEERAENDPDKRIRLFAGTAAEILFPEPGN